MFQEGQPIPEELAAQDETAAESENTNEFENILRLHPNELLRLMETGQLSRPILIEEVLSDIPRHADIVKIGKIIYEKSQHPEELHPSGTIEPHYDEVKVATFELREGIRIPVIYKPRNGGGKGTKGKVHTYSFDGGHTEIKAEIITDHSIERNVLTWILYDELFNKTQNEQGETEPKEESSVDDCMVPPTVYRKDIAEEWGGEGLVRLFYPEDDYQFYLQVVNQIGDEDRAKRFDNRFKRSDEYKKLALLFLLFFEIDGRYENWLTSTDVSKPTKIKYIDGICMTNHFRDIQRQHQDPYSHTLNPVSHFRRLFQEKHNRNDLELSDETIDALEQFIAREQEIKERIIKIIGNKVYEIHSPLWDDMFERARCIAETRDKSRGVKGFLNPATELI